MFRKTSKTEVQVVVFLKNIHLIRFQRIGECIFDSWQIHISSAASFRLDQLIIRWNSVATILIIWDHSLFRALSRSNAVYLAWLLVGNRESIKLIGDIFISLRMLLCFRDVTRGNIDYYTTTTITATTNCTSHSVVNHHRSIPWIQIIYFVLGWWNQSFCHMFGKVTLSK